MPKLNGTSGDEPKSSRIYWSGCRDSNSGPLDPQAIQDTRVHALTAIKSNDGTTRALDLGRDLPQLEGAIRLVKPVLVIIDPVSAYLPKVDTWRDSEVRSVLGLWRHWPSGTAA